MARQRRLFLSRSAADSGSSSSSTQMDISGAGSDMQNKDLYFCMPDKKVAACFISNLSFTSFFFYIPYICFLILFSLFGQELRVLFKKELKKSDVGSWGRIVIPKVRSLLILFFF